MTVTKQQFILIGELHGTREIPRSIEKLLAAIPDVAVVCFEIPETDRTAFFNEVEDGRQAWKELVAKLEDKNIRVVGIDEGKGKSQNEHELLLAHAVLRAAKHLQGTIVVITGDVHASKKAVPFPGITILPMGAHLHAAAPSMRTIQITAKSGTIYNHGTQTIQENLTQPELFDEVILLENVTAYERHTH